MQFKYAVKILFLCIGVLPLQYAYSNYKIVPKSIDRKHIKWRGNVGKYKTNAMTAYVLKIDEIPFCKFKFEIEGVLRIHDKKAPKGIRYHTEYWTRDGFALHDLGDYVREVKKKYHWYKNLYKKRKRRK